MKLPVICPHLLAMPVNIRCIFNCVLISSKEIIPKGALMPLPHAVQWTRRGRKKGNVLFNDAINTFYLRLYGVDHMVKYHSDSERKPAAATWATLSD